MVNENEIFVPREVYLDLSDVNRLELTADTGSVQMKLECSDASESYSVRIWFDTHRILRKTISIGSDKEQVLADTRYFDPNPPAQLPSGK